MSVRSPDPLIGGESPRKVAILRALQLGDLLCAVPVFRALRSAWPEAEIVLVGLPWARSFADRFVVYLDGFREFPGFPGLPEISPEIGRIPGFLAEIQDEKFDLAIQLHGSGSFVNPLVALFGAQRTAGFALPGDYRPDPDLFIDWPNQGLEINRLLMLVDSLGVPRKGDHLEFPVRAADREALHGMEGVGELASNAYICIHPGASVAERRWLPESFAAVADSLADRGLKVALTGSSGEAGLTRAVAAAMRNPTVDLAGKTDLGPLAALIDGARLMVGNDTGVAHLAVARKVSSVIVSTGDNPARWAPIDTGRHRVLCDDARGVSVGAVLAQADALLSLEDHHPGPSPAVAPDLGDAFGDLKG